MRDQYAGDISDYLKFAFLRANTPKVSQLGVAWYYLPGHDGRADGRHDDYLNDLHWRALDPDLFDRLRHRSDRSIAELETLSVLPSSTRFHKAPVPRGRERAAWRDQMIAQLSVCDTVFADPDNGVSRSGVVNRKSATVDEVNDLCGQGRMAVLIRFPHRLSTHDDQLANYHAIFAAFAPLTLRTCVRVANGNGTTSPRIRWFTVLNPRSDTKSHILSFAAKLGAIPSATVRFDD